MTNTYQAITGLPFARTCAITLAIVGASLAAQIAPYDSAKPLRGDVVCARHHLHRRLRIAPDFTPDGREIYFLKMAPNFSRWTIFPFRATRTAAGRNRRSRRSPVNFRTPILTSPLMENTFTLSPIAPWRRAANASRITTSGSWTRRTPAGVRRAICQRRSTAIRIIFIRSP